MLKSFFLCERKLVNAFLKVRLEYIKDVSFSLNEMLFAMQKKDLNVFELFCRASYVRASMHKITCLQFLGSLIAVLVQKSKLRELQARKASFSLRECWLMQF